MPLASLPPEFANWLVAVWIFAIGAAVGSFLNVVVYRLPLGMSLVRPGSHCPACKHPIRWYDNVPILGWLGLRGRCRDCRATISPRYPIVEAITAGLFVLLGAVAWLSDGANLPLRTAALPEDPTLPARTAAELLATSGYLLVLACTLLTAVLIEWDGQRVPGRLFAVASAVGLLAPVAWAALRPVAACPALPDGPLAGLADGLSGLAAGGVLGWLASRPADARRKTAWLMCPLCIGLFLGWQAVLVIAPLAAALYLLLTGMGGRFSPLKRVPPTAWLLLITVAWILIWRRLAG